MELLILIKLNSAITHFIYVGKTKRGMKNEIKQDAGGMPFYLIHFQREETKQVVLWVLFSSNLMFPFSLKHSTKWYISFPTCPTKDFPSSLFFLFIFLSETSLYPRFSKVASRAAMPPTRSMSQFEGVVGSVLVPVYGFWWRNLPGYNKSGYPDFPNVPAI